MRSSASTTLHEAVSVRSSSGPRVRVASTRRRRIGASTPTQSSSPRTVAAPDELTDQKRLRERFDAILERMDHDTRVILVLVEVEGLTVPEAAELLEIPTGTVARGSAARREFFEAELKRIEARTALRGGRP